MASPFLAIYTKSLCRIYYAEPIDEAAASSIMEHKVPVSIEKSGTCVGYSIATLRAAPEVEAGQHPNKDRDAASGSCFSRPFAASDAS